MATYGTPLLQRLLPTLMQLKLLEDANRRTFMEKYGVELDPEKEKTASKDKTCPKCGRALSEPSKCDHCGTEGFEKKQEDDGGSGSGVGIGGGGD